MINNITLHPFVCFYDKVGEYIVLDGEEAYSRARMTKTGQAAAADGENNSNINLKRQKKEACPPGVDDKKRVHMLVVLLGAVDVDEENIANGL